MEIGEPERHRRDSGAATRLPAGGEHDRSPASRAPSRRVPPQQVPQQQVPQQPPPSRSLPPPQRSRWQQQPPLPQPPPRTPPPQPPRQQQPLPRSSQPPLPRPSQQQPPRPPLFQPPLPQPPQPRPAQPPAPQPPAPQPPSRPSRQPASPVRRAGHPSPPAPRAHDPFTDSDAVGLRKFNIGLVPASATPPGTWKRAAWFAVLSSAGVLVGLALAASKLVGTGEPAERVGLPGYPTGVPLLPGFATETPPPRATPAPHTPGTPAPNTRVPERVDEPEELRAPEAERRAAGGESPEEPAGPATAGPATTGPAARTGLPEVTTVPRGDGPPLVDGAAIATRTEKFYEAAVLDSGTAMAMVSDSFRPGAEELLAQQFADVSLIEVTAIQVDPTKGVTLSTLQVTRKDGAKVTEERQLEFTTTGEPLINAERPAETVQRSFANVKRYVIP
ncbi:hypothetical protein ACFV4N_03820 [Actinosynnema sp. NPDC059797]